MWQHLIVLLCCLVACAALRTLQRCQTANRQNKPHKAPLMAGSHLGTSAHLRKCASSHRWNARMVVTKSMMVVVVVVVVMVVVMVMVEAVVVVMLAAVPPIPLVPVLTALPLVVAVTVPGLQRPLGFLPTAS